LRWWLGNTAVSGGHILHMLCDLTIAADSNFGQTGPKVGSFDGFGASYLAQVSVKHAKFGSFAVSTLPHKSGYMGLAVNCVVPGGTAGTEVFSGLRKF